MSKSGLPELNITKAGTISVAIVCARWHNEICEQLIENSKRACEESEIKDVPVYRVSGSFELLPVVTQLTQHYDAVIALGVIIQGETPHFDYISKAVIDGFARISIENITAIGNGVLTTYSEEQAWDRSGRPGSKEDKATEATLAAIDAALTLRKIRMSIGE